MRRAFWILAAMVFVGYIATPTRADAAEDPRPITWTDLMPEGEAERLAEFTDTDIKLLFGHGTLEDRETPISMLQQGTFNTVAELDGVPVAIEGFVVPFDFAPGQGITEFLLVPYYGACIHVPPPPPNQMIYVTSSEPVVLERMWAPVRLEGVLSTTSRPSDVGDSAYAMALSGFNVVRR